MRITENTRWWRVSTDAKEVTLLEIGPRGLVDYELGHPNRYVFDNKAEAEAMYDVLRIDRANRLRQEADRLERAVRESDEAPPVPEPQPQPRPRAARTPRPPAKT